MVYLQIWFVNGVMHFAHTLAPPKARPLGMGDDASAWVFVQEEGRHVREQR